MNVLKKDGYTLLPESVRSLEGYRHSLKGALQELGFTSEVLYSIKRAGCEPFLNYECGQFELALPLPQTLQAVTEELVPWAPVYFSRITLGGNEGYMQMNLWNEPHLGIINPLHNSDFPYVDPLILFDFQGREYSPFRFRRDGSASFREHHPITDEMMSDMIHLVDLVAREQTRYASSNPVHAIGFNPDLPKNRR